MRIYIKQPNKRRILIPVPLPTLLIRLLVSNRLKQFILKYTHGKSKLWIELIDFNAVSSSISTLKRYKGLRLVEVVSAEGDEVTIII